MTGFSAAEVPAPGQRYPAVSLQPQYQQHVPLTETLAPVFEMPLEKQNSRLPGTAATETTNTKPKLLNKTQAHKWKKHTQVLPRVRLIRMYTHYT